MLDDLIFFLLMNRLIFFGLLLFFSLFWVGLLIGGLFFENELIIIFVFDFGLFRFLLAFFRDHLGLLF